MKREWRALLLSAEIRLYLLLPTTTPKGVYEERVACSPPLSGDRVILAASEDHAGPVLVHEERVACSPPLSRDRVILAAPEDHAGPVGVHEERVACSPPLGR